MTWRQLFRDFLRGFSDADLESLSAKLERVGDIAPGHIIYLTNAEAAALGEHYRRRHLIVVTP